MKKGRTQSLHFWSNFDPRFPLKMVTIKEEVVAWKNHSHWAIKICQNEGSTFSPLSEKNTITFCTIQVFFGLKQGGVTSQRVGITHTIPGQLLVKKLGYNTFPFRGYRSQRVFKFGYFSWYHTYIFEKIGLDIPIEFNARSNQISNPKRKNQKACVSFSNCPFLF